MGINVDKEIVRLENEIRQLRAIQKDPKVRMHHYFVCRDCGEVFHVVMNDYAQEGYCHDCWVKKLAREFKEKNKDLIGSVIIDYELDTEDWSLRWRPRFSKLTIEKDGKKRVLEAAEVQHFLL